MKHYFSTSRVEFTSMFCSKGVNMFLSVSLNDYCA